MAIHDHIEAARKSILAARRELMDLLRKEQGRRRGPMVRQLHEIDRMLDSRYVYASQAGQDRVIDKLMNNKRDGVFVDVGGYDGLTGSNSWFFELYRGWNGILIEPTNEQYDIAKSRRRCECLPYAIAESEGQADFISVNNGYTQMSGLSDHYEPELLEKVRSNPKHEEQIVKVETKTLAGVLKEANLGSIDFISLDIEGGEIAVLDVFPFKDFDIQSWAIENNTGTSEINKIMKANGYVLVEFCGPDEIYKLAD